MKQLISALLLLAFSPIYANEPPDATLDAAAIHALRNAFHQPQSKKWEYGGFIYKRADQFYIHAPETQRVVNHITIHYPSTDATALYHTHPCYPYSYRPHEFSIDDKMAAMDHMTMAYVLDACTGDVLKFSPTANILYDKHRRLKLDVVDSTIGTVIGNIEEKSEEQEKPPPLWVEQTKSDP